MLRLVKCSPRAGDFIYYPAYFSAYGQFTHALIGRATEEDWERVLLVIFDIPDMTLHYNLALAEIASASGKSPERVLLELHGEELATLARDHVNSLGEYKRLAQGPVRETHYTTDKAKLRDEQAMKAHRVSRAVERGEQVERELAEQREYALQVLDYAFDEKRPDSIPRTIAWLHNHSRDSDYAARMRLAGTVCQRLTDYMAVKSHLEGWKAYTDDACAFHSACLAFVWGGDWVFDGMR